MARERSETNRRDVAEAWKANRAAWREGVGTKAVRAWLRYFRLRRETSPRARRRFEAGLAPAGVV